MPGILVCSSFLISVCMFIVSKALLISSATVIIIINYYKIKLLLFAQGGGAFGWTPLLRRCLMCVVPSL